MDYAVNNQRITDLPFTALGGSPTFASADLERFLAEDHIAVMSYLRADGRPNQVPLWFTYRDGTMWFNVETGSAKHRALRKDPRVCVTVQDERPPYRAVIIEGTVELVDAGQDRAMSMDMAVHYFGRLGAKAYQQMYEESDTGAGTTTLRLHPTEVKGFDNSRAIGKGLLAFARIRHRLPIPRPWL